MLMITVKYVLIVGSLRNLSICQYISRSNIKKPHTRGGNMAVSCSRSRDKQHEQDGYIYGLLPVTARKPALDVRLVKVR